MLKVGDRVRTTRHIGNIPTGTEATVAKAHGSFIIATVDGYGTVFYAPDELEPVEQGHTVVRFDRVLPDGTPGVLIEVAGERVGQDDRWGQQDHPDGTGGDGWARRAEAVKRATDRAARDGELTWHHVLKEEFAEAMAEDDPARLREELVQVAAVAVAWVEAIDRRAE